MICNLCREDKPLIKKSHVIPNFMYDGLFCEKHFLNYINLARLKERKRVPDGIYEKNILCQKCESEVLGSLESYASKALHGRGALPEAQRLKFEYREGEDGLITILISNIDYRKYKLFLLSILWKAHISKHEFFSEVNLGKYADVIRRMIYENNPGDDDEFETALVLIISDEVMAKSIIAPRCIKDEGNTSYAFCINGIIYHFNISKHGKLPFFEKTYIGKDNIMQIAVPAKEFANDYFDSFLGKRVRLKSKESNRRND